MNQVAELPAKSRLRDLSATLRMLILERCKSEAELNLHELQRAGFRCEARIITTREEFLGELSSFRYDVVLSSQSLQDWTGLDALEILRQSGKALPFIFVTETLGEEMAVECFRQGATDYVLKNRRAELPQALHRALETKAMQDAHTLMVQALHLSEESSHFLFSCNPLPMCVFDVETLDFLEMNQAAIAHYGFERHEFLQMRLSDLHPPDEIPQLLSAIRENSGNTQVPEKWHHCLKNGSSTDVELYFHPLEYAGRAASMIVAQDCTRRSALEEQLQRVQKFEAIGKLSGGLAHDFNNVIGAILGWADIGEEQAAPLDPKLALYFKKIHGQCDRVTTLIAQLLAFSRRQSSEPASLNLNKTVRDALHFLVRTIGANVGINTILAEDLPEVHADPSQVEQVLVNLCINARDAMAMGGTILIETRNAQFATQDGGKNSGQRAGDFVELSVKDAGIGLDSAVLQRISEPSFGIREAGDMAGMGLATTYGIVRQHNGFIQVESKPGHGSVFHIFFPVHTQHRGAGIQPSVLGARQLNAGTETILIAEDHEGMRDMACALLQSMGHAVVLAKDGREALEIFSARRNSIDLVVLNVNMPHCGGLEVYEAMKALKPDVPVLFSTGHSTENAVLGRLLQTGIPILRKPFSPAMLCSKIREALARSGSGHTQAQSVPQDPANPV